MYVHVCIYAVNVVYRVDSDNYIHVLYTGERLLIVTYVIHVQDGRTAFYISCQNGHVAVFQLLLQKHADVSICKKVC